MNPSQYFLDPGLRMREYYAQLDVQSEKLFRNGSLVNWSINCLKPRYYYANTLVWLRTRTLGTINVFMKRI